MSNEGKKWKMRYGGKEINFESDEYVDLNDSHGMSDEQFNKWLNDYKDRMNRKKEELIKKEEERVKNMTDDERDIDYFYKYFGLK